MGIFFGVIGIAILHFVLCWIYLEFGKYIIREYPDAEYFNNLVIGRAYVIFLGVPLISVFGTLILTCYMAYREVKEGIEDGSYEKILNDEILQYWKGDFPTDSTKILTRTIELPKLPESGTIDYSKYEPIERINLYRKENPVTWKTSGHYD